MLKTIAKRSGLGFLLGVIIGNGIAMITALPSSGAFCPVSQALLQQAGSLEAALFWQTLLSGLYGALCFGGTVLYDVERLPLAAASALHCGMIVLAYIPVSLLLGWVSSLTETLIILAIQLVVYVCIWLILYAIYKAQTKKLNDMQTAFQRRQQEGPHNQDF